MKAVGAFVGFYDVKISDVHVKHSSCVSYKCWILKYFTENYLPD